MQLADFSDIDTKWREKFARDNDFRVVDFIFNASQQRGFLADNNLDDVTKANLSVLGFDTLANNYKLLNAASY